eukprot:5379969-Pyramimonas_sp.AAC.1
MDFLDAWAGEAESSASEGGSALFWSPAGPPEEAPVEAPAAAEAVDQAAAQQAPGAASVEAVVDLWAAEADDEAAAPVNPAVNRRRLRKVFKAALRDELVSVLPQIRQARAPPEVPDAPALMLLPPPPDDPIVPPIEDIPAMEDVVADGPEALAGLALALPGGGPGDHHVPDIASSPDTVVRYGRFLEATATSFGVMCRILSLLGEGAKHYAPAERVHSHLTSADNVLLTCKTLNEHARRSGTERRQFAKKSMLCASVTWVGYLHSMRCSIQAIIDNVQAKSGILQTFFVFYREDETPLKMTVSDTDSLYGLPAAIVDKVWYHFQDVADATSGVAKILQSEIIVAVTVMVSNSMKIFSWKVPCPVQSLGRTTGETYFQAAALRDEMLGVGPLAAQFRRRHHFFCTDRDGALAKARRAKLHSARQQYEAFTDTITACGVHIKN